ncbi:MAG TPA: hypothetical protein DGT21_10205 [Armatimonadetes bacterium]|nr:hypothetical protein [Armatimonadota bacterium]
MLEHWAAQLSGQLSDGGVGLLPVAFLAGLCTSLNPCAYPVIAAVAGYLWGQGRAGGPARVSAAAAVLAGLCIVYVTLGLAGSMLAPLLGLSMRHWAFVAGSILVLAGAFTADLLPLNFAAVSPLARYWERLRGIPGAFTLGILLGLVATPCATPPLVAILSMATARQAPAYAATLMLFYALGHALPAVLLGVCAGSVAGLERLAPHGYRLRIAGGWLLIAVGFSVLWHA